jgi:signal transduction histidine kinase
VSQAITSVRDPEQLLTRVVDVIRDRFVYSAVAIYIVPPAGSTAMLNAVSPRISDMRTLDNDSYRVWPEVFHRGDGSVVDKAMETREIQIERKVSPGPVGWYQRISCRIAIPLKMESNLVGIIGVDTSALDGLQDDELEVLELLGNQVTIALENARVYERERLAVEQLEAAEVFKSRFLGNMSHELREPLNTIIGFSRLLMKGVEGSLNEQQLEDVEQIYIDSQHLMFLINDILTISQIQAGLMELKLQPVFLSEIVDGVMPTAGALVRGKEIELVQQVPDDIPPICADPHRLRQILIHLLNNAAKYTKRGWIKIRAWQHDAYVYISVIDTGIGIPVQDRERVFAQFEQVGQRKGAGLGLALCKEFVELHGGSIWVDSEVNSGSTFTFSIPVYKEEFVESAPPKK